MQTTATEVLPEIVRRLVAEFDPEEIILFGSRAWGNPRLDSDYDVWVFVSDAHEKPTRARDTGLTLLARDSRAHGFDREYPSGV